MSDRRLRDGLRPCLWTFVGLRVGLFVLAAIAVGVIPVRTDLPVVPGWPAPAIGHGWHAIFTAFERQDALWFLRIATTGYAKGDGSAAFFPLYPLTIRIVSWIVGGRPLLAATLVSNASFFLALLVLYDLTTFHYSDAVARRTIVLLAVFPTAFFFLAPYSESLFLLLSLLTFRWARRDRWALAALAAALAALTRSIGIVLVPALLVMAFERWRAEGGALWPRLLGALGALLGPIAYFAWWGLAHGEALAPFRAQQNWDRRAVFPLTTLWRAVLMASGRLGIADPGYWIIDVLVVGVVLLAVVIGWRRMELPYLVYALGSLLVPLAYPFPARPLLSMPRFVAVIFPAFWVLGDASERHEQLYAPLVASFAAGLGLLATLFVNWWHIF